MARPWIDVGGPIPGGVLHLVLSMSASSLILHVSDVEPEVDVATVRLEPVFPAATFAGLIISFRRD